MSRVSVLVTGATGGLGRKIVGMLLKSGYTVFALVRETSNLQLLKTLYRDYPFFFIFFKEVEDVFVRRDIRFVIHTATCYGLEKDSVDDIVEANLTVPAKLFALSQQHGVSAFLNADTFFEPSLGIGGKRQLYISTKKEFLSIARKQAAREHGCVFVNMRIEHMYGPDDSKDKFICFILNSCLSNVPNISLTDGAQKRDFVFVDDVASAFVKTIQCAGGLSSYEEFGIGSGASMSIKDAVFLIHQMTKSRTVLEWGALPYRESEIFDSKASLTNNYKIGWKTSVSFTDGIAMVIAKHVPYDPLVVS
jgi:CDP-paratose synthetase